MLPESNLSCHQGSSDRPFQFSLYSSPSETQGGTSEYRHEMDEALSALMSALRFQADQPNVEETRISSENPAWL